MVKKEYSPNLISQSAAADLIGVKRQAINGLKDKYDFFVGNKVDINSESWSSYLHERESRLAGNSRTDKIKPDNVPPVSNKIAVNKNKPMKRIQGQQQSDKKKLLKSNLSDTEIHALDEKQEHALTGGFNPDNYIPKNLADVERYAKISNLQMQMRIRLGELIERDLVETVIDIFQQNIQSHFVDLPRRVSGLICKKLDRVGAEKEIEKILTGPIAKGISECKKISINSAELKRLSDEAFRDGQNELQNPQE
jgi:hypothetical protein